MPHNCGVRIFAHRDNCPEKADRLHCESEKCQIGCFNAARHLNPFFGKETPTEEYWWRNPYNYAEWLCAECYDGAMDMLKEYEEMYG